MDDFSRVYIAREYASGTALAERYADLPNMSAQVLMFKEVAKESDYCILGFIDGLAS